MSVQPLSAYDKLVRKLRKKLRQIEHLETSGRLLNEEENFKVKSKGSIRAELAQLLKTSENQATSDPLNETEESLCSPANIKITQDNLEICSGEEEPSTFPVHEEPINMKRATISDHSNDDPITKNPEEKEVKQASVEKKQKIETVGSSLPTPNYPSASSSEMQQNRAPSVVPGTSQGIQHTAQILPAFIFTNLESDGGLICCVDVNESLVLSGSRDTVVQVWDARTGDVKQSLRGHTNGVTGAILLSACESQELAQILNLTESPKMAITTSLDCYIKLWNLESGTAVSSIYTFSSITAVCYSPTFHCCVVGSEGGKLEVYSFASDRNGPVHSIKAFDEAVSAIRLQGNHMVCSSLDGYVSVWTLVDSSGLQLSRKYVSENLTGQSGRPVAFRPVRCLALGSHVPDGSFYYGDEGANLKVVRWRNSEVNKLKNHIHEVGITNAMCATSRLLFSSSVDLDTGNAAINVRSLPDEQYLYTLNFGQIGQIACLAVWESDDQLRLAVGGSKLFVLEVKSGNRHARTKRKILKPAIVSELSECAEDSDDESLPSSSDESEEEVEPVVMEPADDVTSSGSWCRIL